MSYTCKTIVWTNLLLTTVCAGQAADQRARLTVTVDQPGIRVSPLLYGIFFEEINRAGDGGIYAEMIQNRSFEDGDRALAWSLVTAGGGEGSLAIDSGRPLNEHSPRALRIDIRQAGGRVGAANEGFRGIAVKSGATYELMFYARCCEKFRGPLTASIEASDGKVLASHSVAGIGSDWKKFDCRLTATATDAKARLVIAAAAPGTVWLDVVSLFPQETFKSRPNGLRPDLAKMLLDMKPAFVRFPGGCYVEGDELANAFRWKKTIGDIARRPGHWNLWGYRSNDGLGYHEYLQMCEDLNAEPLFVINCGMAHKDHVPLDKMGEYVQDALDAIEYANGPADSTWGGLRAKHGHPAPFHLKYIEIGNENGGPLYHERFALFCDAIKAKSPAMQIVANEWGGVPKSRPIEILDEHYYNSPEFFLSRADMYDKYDRQRYRVYVGEYAVTQGCGQGNLQAAVGEAAYMTGLERNSDVVVMASYAPLFCHPGWKRWNPNAINFDAARVYGTPSYYVQAMFANHRADVVLPTDIEQPAVPAAPARRGMIGVGTWATQAEYKDIRVTKGGQTLFASDFGKGLAGWRKISGEWQVRDGVLRQSSPATDLRIVGGDPNWSDYTLSLKARQVGGAEGFLILFQVQNDQEKSWWNLGGWGNREHAIEAPGVHCPHVPGKIETGRWYDIRIELDGPRIRCYLDNKLVHDVVRAAVRPLYAVAGRKTDSGEVILKVVNAYDKAVDTAIALQGAKEVGAAGRAIVLTSAGPADENSFDEPRKVSPQESSCQTAAHFRHVFPAHSVTILRVPAAK
jgi:alpha-L-arabinofuranosidase